MAKAAFYVDGFNLYHALKGHPKTAKALWLDLWSLCNALKAPGSVLGQVVYFTALTPWNPDKALRHQTFLSALKHTGVEVVLGRFAPTEKECALCRRLYGTHEEKETDVNISSRMILDGARNHYDTCYLVSGDSDQVPTMKAIRELAPDKELVAVFPPRRHAAELKGIADRSIQLSVDHFPRNQLPDPVVLRPGVELRCPPSWKP